MGFLFGGNTADKLNQGVAQDPNLAKNQALLAQQRAALAGQMSTQMNTAQSDQARGVQAGLMDQLQKQASGQGPSLAAAQANQTADRGIAQQMALAAGQGGGTNPALVQRQALMNQANIAQGAAAMATQGRMQEQLNAQGALAGLSGTVRGQDINQAGAQAQLDAAHQQQVNSLTQQYIAMGMTADQAQFQAQNDMEKVRAGMLQGDADRFAKGIGGIINAGSALGVAGIFGGKNGGRT